MVSSLTMEKTGIPDMPESNNRPKVLPRDFETKIYEVFGHVSAFIIVPV
jgi:hypothetical protein